MTFEEVFGMGVTTVIDFIARYFLKSRNYAQNSSSPDGSSYISTSQSAAAVRNVSTYTSNMSSSNGAPPAILPLPSIVGRSSNINRMV